jgi:hypothetical protein
MVDDAKGSDSKDVKAHKFFTFERMIEIVKLLATVWIALIGSFVTMQFNERQHELSRMEAIAKMLPHVSASGDKDDKPNGAAPSEGSTPLITKSDMGRDGAIWAMFRTANNKTMLRDLAALFPEDIYRVVSSIAVAGGLEHDSEAITALQVASEKLAAKFSSDPRHAEIATRLYNQAVHLKERKPDDTSPLTIVDLTTPEVESNEPSQDQQASLINSLNRLAALHLLDSQATGRKISTGHWQAKQMFKKARQLGKDSKDKLVQVQVALADRNLGQIYLEDGHPNDALLYLQEGHDLLGTVGGDNKKELELFDLSIQKAKANLANR